jgi:hypothetical protein
MNQRPLREHKKEKIPSAWPVGVSPFNHQLSTGLKVALPRGIVMLNLGMRFSNKGGVRLNLGTMDRFISMISIM